VAADPALETVLHGLVINPVSIQKAPVCFQLSAFSCDALRIDFPDDLAAVRQPVLDFKDPKWLVDRTDARLLFIDDQVVFFGNFPEAFQKFLQECSARMNCVKVVGVSTVSLHALDNLGIVVKPIRIDDPDVLRRLGADVAALPQPLLTG
jgi:hypothetical protein